MTANISSLDIALRRIESIERQFNTLSGVQFNQKPDTDFQAILNSNIAKTENAETKVMQEFRPTQSRAEIENLIEKYAQKNNLDKDFVKAVIKQESGFNAKATSHCGAMGLMQLMPQTAMSLGVENAYDVEAVAQIFIKDVESLINSKYFDMKIESNKKINEPDLSEITVASDDNYESDDFDSELGRLI